MSFALLAGVLGFIGVAAGAFGAHALRDRLAPELMSAYQTGVLYHLVHAVALLGVAWLVTRDGSLAARAAGLCFVAGIVLFSGSLYTMALTGVRALGAVTPFGGVAFLAGWVCVCIAALRG